MCFPDGSQRKAERVEKADAQSDLDELLTLRAHEVGDKYVGQMTPKTKRSKR